jgi:hypothetical protein
MHGNESEETMNYFSQQMGPYLYKMCIKWEKRLDIEKLNVFRLGLSVGILTYVLHFLIQNDNLFKNYFL